MNDPSVVLTIAVLGGTGKEGKGLAYRWAKAGYRVIIGSRSDQKAITAAAELVESLDGAASVVGTSNVEAVRDADIVVLTVPYSAHRKILRSVAEAIKGKLLIDVTVPLVPGQLSKAHMPTAGSAAQEARRVLGPEAEIAAAFHNVPHEYLLQDGALDSDVLVTGTSKEARAETLKLVSAAGLNGWDAGVLENSMVTEGLASILIHINRRYGSTHAGIKITGLDSH
jgi:NADPH-dependent F420 reductase